MKKTAVIIGKGPSAKEVKKSDEYDIIAINNSVILCEEVDVLVSNDMETLDNIPTEDWDKIKKVVIPTYPHKDFNAQDKYTWKTFLERIPKKIDYFVHKLKTHRGGFDEFESLGPSYSSGTTAIQYAAKCGYEEVLYCGIDPEGGYNPIFERKDENGNPLNHQCRPESNHVYPTNFKIFHEIANANNIKLRKF